MKKQEIRFQKSLFRFFASVFFSLIVAISLNSLVNSLPIDDWIDEALRSHSLKDVKVHQPSLGFKKGLLPAITLRLDRLEWADPRCEGRKLLGQSMTLPLKPLSLIGGDIQFGHMSLDFVDFHEPGSCSKPKRSSLLTQATTSAGQIQKGHDPTESEDRFAHDFQRWGKKVPKVWPLTGLKIQKLNFSHLVREKEVLTVGALKLDLKSAPQLFFDIEQVQLENRELPLRKTQLTAELKPEHLQVQLKSRVREGRLSADILLPFLEGEKALVRLQSSKLPLSHLSAHFLNENRLAYLWLGCRAQLESPLPTLLNTPFAFEKCEASGPYGAIVLGDSHVTLSEVQSLALNIQKLQLDQVIKNRRQAYLSGVLSQFGVLNQSLVYRDGVFESKGRLAKLEFIFSRQNQRELQKVANLSFLVKGTKESWQAQLGELDLDGGDFRGEVKLQKKPKEDTIHGQVSFHRIQVSPAIYRLLFRSLPTSVSLYGDFALLGDELREWSLLAATGQLKGENYLLENLKVRGQGGGQKEKAKLKISASRGEIKQSSALRAWLRPTILEAQWDEDPLKFRELSAHLQVSGERRFAWQRAYVRMANGWQLSTEGRHFREEGLQAWMQWDRPDGRYLKWNYQGPLFKGTWKPETPWVKSWLLANEEFMLNNKQIQIDLSGEGA